MRKDENNSGDFVHQNVAGRQKPLVVRVTDNDFQRDVLDKLGRLETKMDMLMGGASPAG